MKAFAPSAPSPDDYALRVGMACWATVIEGGVPVWRCGWIVRKERRGAWYDVAIPDEPASEQIGALLGYLPPPRMSEMRIVRRVPGVLCKTVYWPRGALS